MLTVTELISEVRDCALGASYDDQVYLKYLNRGQDRISGMVLLPDLGTSKEIETDPELPYVTLPTDFQRELQTIRSANSKAPVKIYRSWMEFMKKYPDLDWTGAAVEVASVRARRLYYQPLVLATDTLTIYYYRLPTPMVALDDPGPLDQTSPDGLPSHLADDLLVNFAAVEVWKLIEQDDMQQSNVAKYAQRFNSAMADLLQFVSPPDGEPDYIRDEWGR